ncbi:MAG TPA: metallophosphoesterase [Actinomycetota bacterium]|nr:metallophosphoesterase [Actinomycetota bacterium]
MTGDAAYDVTTDLLRSAWIIHEGRRRLLGEWARHGGRFDESAQRAALCAALFEEALEGRIRRSQDGLAEGHKEWIRRAVGSAPGEVPFGDLFIVRLGDWVEAHAGAFLDDAAAARLKEIGDDERASMSWPEALPAAAPFEPVETIPAEAPGEVRFRFGILGDLHFGSARGEMMARAAIADLNQSGAELVIQLGDITERGNRAEFELAARVLGDLEMPLTTMLGNHDVYSYNEEKLLAREFYPASFGRDPDGVLIEHRGFRFAVLDSAEHATSPFAPFSLVTGQFLEGTGGATVRGVLTPPQHEILAEVAAPGSPPAFVFLHHPVQPFTGFPPVLFGLTDTDTGRLHAVCDSGNVWGVFSGHTHRNARTREFGRVPAQEVAIPRDYPFGYAVVDVSDAGYAFRFVQLSDHDLLREASSAASAIHRRYGLGAPHERSFTWTRTPEN